MEVTKVPKKIVTVIEPKRSMTVDKEKYRQKKVAAYCRVSTDSEEQLVSYANQKKVYTEMIASRKDWCFAGLFADEGKSGTRADKRPEFNKMINDCLAGKIDYIITKSVSRFARNTVDCLDYVRMLKSKGIGVYFEEQQIDTLKTDSELYLVIYAGFAQSESESISKNITWSVRKKFEEGTPVFIYKRFLGYKKGADGEPEIVPSEAAIVERIFNLYLAGETVDNISKMMQAENYANATYKALMRATISEALGLNGDPEEVDMLERKVEALNNKMLALVNESVSSGDGIEAHESEFMTLSQETELLKQRIAAIQESTAKDNGEQSRIEQIQAIISERESKCMEYDDSIVRQMVECIKVYPGGKLEIIFGGGYLVEESV